MPRVPRLAAAEEVASHLRGSLKRNLVAAGVYGSTATSQDRPDSDIDLLVVVRSRRPDLDIRVHRGYLVTILQMTPEEAEDEVLGARSDLSEALGGWQSMRPLFDPSGLLAHLSAHAHRPRAGQFRRAARRALLETYEDYGKLRNAIASRDRDEMREMAVWFTGAAHMVVFDLARTVLPTGRRAFIELRRHGRLGKALLRLRYGSPSIRETERLARYVWRELRRRARAQGISLRGLA